MNLKLIGGILLIIGTSIGGGILALPAATAQAGFLGALVLLIGSWFVMAVSALIILEVVSRLPKDSNILSMSRQYLGKYSEIFAWLIYLALFYSLLAAYISGGSGILQGMLEAWHIPISNWLAAAAFTLIFSSIVFLGIRVVDYTNRSLMTFKLVALILLILFIMPHSHYKMLDHFDGSYLVGSITIVITSYGFANIVPSLRDYFDNDVKQLRKAILIGSAIPLVCYTIWVGVIMANLPLQGPYGLLAILHAKHSPEALTHSLIYILKTSWIHTLATIFVSICVLTSFLGVSIALYDFIADGLRLKKQGFNRVIIQLATFIPPLLIVIAYPAAFIMALSFAGTFCVILLVLMPALMAYRARYIFNETDPYQVFGGRFLLIMIAIIALAVIIQELLLDLHIL